MRLSLVIFLFTAAFFTPLAAQSSTQYQILRDLDIAKNEFLTGNIDSVISQLNSVSDRLTRMQRDRIGVFFPTEFQDFLYEDKESSFGQDLPGRDNYGVVFSRYFQNPEGQTIDVSVVYQDDAILEYSRIINNAFLVKKIPNASVRDVSVYEGLEEYSEDSRYYELNLVVSRELMINVVVNGVSDLDEILMFVGSIDYTGLNRYLSK